MADTQGKDLQADAEFAHAKELDFSYVMQTYGRKQVEFVRGSGMRLYDSAGKEYLDFLSGIGVVALGHCYPPVTEAVVAQAQKLLHVSNYFYVEHRGEVARMLSELLESNDADALGGSPANAAQDGADAHWKTFFANSGAEANEGAIKLARHYGHVKLEGATTVVTAKRSFHGRTLAALFATGQTNKQEAFLPEVSGFVHVPLNDIEALEQAICGPGGKDVAAVMFECIQGEGGVYPCAAEYLQEARKLTRDTGKLLIMDEVQCGLYRTGRPFAFQHYGIVPDVVTVAKAFGNGAPIAGFSAPGPIAALLQPGDHGSTFGGSPLVCAAAEATLQAFSDLDIGARVQASGVYLREGLAALPHVTEVRGKGLMLGAQLDSEVAAEVCTKALQAGLVINAVGKDILRFLPPLIVTNDDIDVLLQTLTAILKEID